MKKPIKSIVTSSLLAVAFGALSVGSTFALFTSQSKTEISVESGIVNIESRATLVSYQSTVEGETIYPITGNTYSNPLIGNRFALDGNIVNIDKMVPGDVLTLKLSAINKSNVKTKTRLVINHATVGTKTDLYPALDLDFSVPNAGNPANLFKWTIHDAVAEDDMAQGVALYDDLTVKITFPDGDNGEILFGAANHDNQYQDAACSIAFGLEAVQGNAATSPIDEINAYLQAEMIIEGQNKTMYEAVQDMKEIEFNDLSVLHYNNVNYVYSLDADQFVAEGTVSSNYHRYFKVYSEMPDSQTFSIYAANDWATANVALNGVGFDAGNASGIATVSYTGLGEENARTNIIRTNALTTSVTVNAPFDVVHHYGQAGSLNLIAVANSSYHEFGTVAFTEVKQGRIVLEKTAKVDQIHIVANNTAPNPELEQEAFLPVIIKDNGVLPANMPAKITRDKVQVAEENLVVKVITVEEKVENVYVYPYTNTATETPTPTGTTQKTEAHNTNVTSTLGELVLDNGSGTAADGELALSTEEKGVAKEKVVIEAIQTACEHTHKHFIVDPTNEDNHYQVCDDCGKKLTESAQHQYDSEHVNTCYICGSSNVITYKVTTDGDEDDSAETFSLSSAIAAYNNNTSENKNYIIEFENGIYDIYPDQDEYIIYQSKVNIGKTLTFKAKNMPANENAEFGVTLRCAHLDNPNDVLNGSSAFFRVSGGSGTTYGGDITFEGLKFDFTTSGCQPGTDMKYGGDRLNAVYLMQGTENRYAHGITMDTCQFVGPGGKLASAVSANTSGSSPSRITISNCVGEKMNTWYNGYTANYPQTDGDNAFGIKLINLQSNNFLVVCNNQGSGSVLIDNVDGTFLYRESGSGTECWLLKIINSISLTIKDSEWRLLGAPNGGNSSNEPGILYLRSSGQVTATISNLTVDRNNHTIPDVCIYGNSSIVINGGTPITDTTNTEIFPSPSIN